MAGALLALGTPIAASAQMFPGGDGPPPEVRAQMEQARTNAKAAAFNDLSADHRAKVEAIVAKFNDGSLEPADAASQIDAILTPDEAKAVLAEQQKLRDAMRQAFAAANGGNAPERPGGYGSRGANRKPDAGRFLLMVSRQPRQQP
jgi:hypothetical protein